MITKKKIAGLYLGIVASTGVAIYGIHNSVEPTFYFSQPPKELTGVANPGITELTIMKTICNPHWSTSSIRPPTSYTTPLKVAAMKQYKLPGTIADYELDHIISLELGGDPRNPKNLWMEPWENRGAKLAKPGMGAESKDKVENYLHDQVCSGHMTLEAAQAAIATDWHAVYLRIAK